MSMDSDLMALDDLPDDARTAVTDAEKAVGVIRDRADAATRDIQQTADEECAAVRARAEADIAAVQQDTTRELAPLVRELVDSLRAMQERYARDGKLDEALAIRARVRQLRADLLGVRPDPGILTEFGADDFGRPMLFEVVGRTDGSVWGTDVYTGDSRLAAAAVHAGAVQPGERALVRVRLDSGDGVEFVGSLRNGVTTFDFAHYPTAYRVERL